MLSGILSSQRATEVNALIHSKTATLDRVQIKGFKNENKGE